MRWLVGLSYTMKRQKADVAAAHVESKRIVQQDLEFFLQISATDTQLARQHS